MSGSGELLFGGTFGPGYVLMQIDTFGPDVSLYGTEDPRRVTRAGWWTLTAQIDPLNGAALLPHAHRIYFIDFERQVFNIDSSWDGGWDRLIWELGPGTSGYVWVF